MRVGIVGLGFRLGYLSRVFTVEVPGFEIVGYVDPDPAGRPYAEKHGVSLGKSYETLETMLQAESSTCSWSAP
jgi:predicted dehydrogenase